MNEANPSEYPFDDAWWRDLDWSRRSADIAREHGFTLDYVRKKRKALGIPRSRNPLPPVPPYGEIPPTIVETCSKFGVHPSVARKWHDLAGIPANPVGPRPKNPPADWSPQKNVRQTAIKYGVSVTLARRWHEMAGVERKLGVPSAVSADDKAKEVSELYGVAMPVAYRWIRQRKLESAIAEARAEAGNLL